MKLNPNIPYLFYFIRKQAGSSEDRETCHKMLTNFLDNHFIGKYPLGNIPIDGKHPVGLIIADTSHDGRRRTLRVGQELGFVDVQLNTDYVKFHELAEIDSPNDEEASMLSSLYADHERRILFQEFIEKNNPDLYTEEVNTVRLRELAVEYKLAQKNITPLIDSLTVQHKLLSNAPITAHVVHLMFDQIESMLSRQRYLNKS